MNKYYKRIADKILLNKLKSKGAVLIEGAKWCGKTTTAKQQAKSILYMQSPKDKKQNLLLADINPEILLQGDTPRLIDEWQIAPVLWDTIRFEVDQRDAFGQFILTGSSVPVMEERLTHTGTGRINRMIMRTMSLYESEEANGAVSLEKLFAGDLDIKGVSKIDLQLLTFFICRGGWPKAISLEDRDIALRQAYDYYDAVVQSDISRADGIVRDKERTKLLLRSYARAVGSQAKATTIRDDMKYNDTDTLSVDTIHSYINALKRIFVLEELPAWNPNLRSKTAIRTAATRYFIDPSIAVAALGLGPQDLINDLNTCGLFFENLCIRDLRCFAEYLDGEVYHYRDASGLECDAVIHLRNGRYGLIEIKLGGTTLVEDGATTLNILADKINTDKMQKPAFKMVLTGTEPYAYKRPDGVLVVPIGCLKM